MDQLRGGEGVGADLMLRGLRGLEGGGDNDEATVLELEGPVRCGEGGGLAGAGCSFDDEYAGAAGECADDVALRGVELAAADGDGLDRLQRAGGDGVDQVGLDGKDMVGGEVADVVWDVGSVAQGAAGADGAAVMSSASSTRAGRSATSPIEATTFSASPRMSAAFQDDRLAPSRVRMSSATASRRTCPTVADFAMDDSTGGQKPRSWSSSCQRRTRSAPSAGTTLSGRASAQERRSQVRHSFGPGSAPGLSARHSAS